MAVKGKGISKTKAFHDREADSVGEGEVVIGVLSKDLACALLICLGCTNDGGGAAINLPQYAQGNGAAKPGKIEGVGLCQDKVGGEKLPPLGDQRGLDRGGRLVVLSGILVGECEKG